MCRIPDQGRDERTAGANRHYGHAFGGTHLVQTQVTCLALPPLVFSLYIEIKLNELPCDLVLLDT